MGEWQELYGADERSLAIAMAGWLAERGEVEVTVCADGDLRVGHRHVARKTDLPGELVTLMKAVGRVEVLGRGGAVLGWLEGGRGAVRSS